MYNLTLEYLKFSGESLSDYDGWCLDLSDSVSQWLEAMGIEHERLFLQAKKSQKYGLCDSIYPCSHLCPDIGWSYHAVTEVSGLVHDAWYSEVLPRQIYLNRMFPLQNVHVETFTDIVKGHKDQADGLTDHFFSHGYKKGVPLRELNITM